MTPGKISTLSATAQTDHVYAREVILVDQQSNLLTIFGTPNNVEVSNAANWRDVYRSIDEANLAFFHAIVESIKIE
jgi:mitochondrial fission protein ELM1